MTADNLENPKIFESNLELLQGWAPELVTIIKGTQTDSHWDVISARTGKPVPVLKGRSLHSSYDPEKEARRLVDSWGVNDSGSQVIFGLGFGYHVEEYLKRVKNPVTVVEPDPAVFRKFLENIPLSSSWKRVRFLIGEPPERILARNQELDWENAFSHPASVQYSQDYFNKIIRCGELASLLDCNQLRVLVVPPIYGGSLPTARFCEQALKEMGHATAMVNCDSFADSFFAIKEVTGNEQHSDILARQFMGMMDEVIVAKAAEFQPDLVLGLAQAPLGESAIKRLKQLDAPVAFWFVEDFRTLTYWKETAPLYDHFFTIQQEPFLDELKSLGVEGYYLPQACSPEIQKPVKLNDEESNTYQADVSFMGAAYYNRLQTFPRLLDFDFKIWGTGFDSGSVLGPLIQNNGDRVSSEDCVKIFNGCKINLNLHSSTFHEGVHPEGDFVNPRTFEIAACGAFQLVDERSELPSLFKEGEEMATFSDIEDLKNKIKWYLKNPGERKAIAEKSRTRVLKEHTFRHRMLELILVVFQNKMEALEQRLKGRTSPVSILKEKAGPESELGRYLNQFEGVQDFSLSAVTEQIKKGEGELSKNELLFLMLDQVVK